MDPIRKAVFAGLGAISVSKAKVEEIMDELVAHGELNAGKRSEMVEQLVKEAETQRRELEKQVRTTVQQSMSDLGLPTRDEYERISIRLAEVEKSLEAIQKDMERSTP